MNPACLQQYLVKGVENGTKVLEGAVPDWKKFGQPGSGNGSEGTTYGLPRFEDARFIARFPFATIDLKDSDIPMDITLTGWSPFIPTDQDNSSLPVGAIEYTFKNTSSRKVDAVFSYSSRNFMSQQGGRNSIKAISNGFILCEDGVKDKPETKGYFAMFTNESSTVTDYCWFRGGWWDPLTMAWKTIMNSEARENPPVAEGAPGATLFVPFSLAPGETRIIRLMTAWYVPDSDLKYGEDDKSRANEDCKDPGCSCKIPWYKPWYSGKFAGINEVSGLLENQL